MRRGQAALEFLATYGWLILIALAAIASLVFFLTGGGTSFAEEKCSIVLWSENHAAGYWYEVKSCGSLKTMCAMHGGEMTSPATYGLACNIFAYGNFSEGRR